jgi:hypothetical protein
MSNNDMPFPDVTGDVEVPMVFKEDTVYTKSEIEREASKQMSKILESGEVDSLKLYAKLKALNEFVLACMVNVKIEALDELDKYADNEDCIVNGMKVTKKSTPKKYSFDHCDTWKNLNLSHKAAQEELKSLEKKMKLSVGTQGWVSEDGEVIPPAEVLDNGKSTIQVTIPNE